MKNYTKKILLAVSIILLAFILTPASFAQTHRGLATDRILQSAHIVPEQGVLPQYIAIPKLSVTVPVEAVGSTDRGNMEVPANWENAGWYEHGVMPGQNGHALLTAHRDWAGQKAPFFRLPELVAGDTIFIVGSNAIQVYTVTTSKNFVYTADPVQAIFSQKNSPHITLITCEGSFVELFGTYDQRRVVQAELSFAFR